MKQDEIIEMPEYLNASYEGDDLYTGDQVRELMKLVAAKERSEMRKGYAGVTLWVGDACVTQIVSEALIEHEIKRGMALKYAAEKCLAIYLEARGEA